MVGVGDGVGMSQMSVSMCRLNNAEFEDQTLVDSQRFVLGSMSRSPFGISICSSLVLITLCTQMIPKYK